MSQTPVTPNAPMPPAGVAPVAPNAPNGPMPPAGVAPVAPRPNGPPVTPADNTGPTAGSDAPKINGPAAPAVGPAEGEAKPKRKARAPRVPFRAEGSDKLTSAELPQGYSAKTHLPLGKDDFAEEAIFYDYKATQARKQVAKYEKMAKECREGGSAEVRKAKKQLSAALEKLIKLRPVIEGAMGADAYQKLVAEAQQQVQQNAANVQQAAAAGL